MTTTVQSIMTQNPHTIGSDQTVSSAHHIMTSLGIRHLPVLEGGRCVGVISDRDIKIVNATDPKRAGEMKVVDACTPDVFMASPESPLADALQVMVRDGLGSVVVAQNNRVVGIFTTVDVCRLLAERLSAES